MAYPEGLTHEMVNSSAEETIEWLKPQLPAIMGLIEQATNLPTEPFSVEEKNERMLGVVDELSSILGPHLVCKKGCHHCCYMAVGITSWEAKRIGDYLDIPVYQPPAMVEPSFYVEKYTGHMCPFLKNKQCSIYEVRPLACRTHFNISKYPEICDIINNPGCDTPSIDLRALWYASAFINLTDGPFGDIREFFPYGADVVQSV